jgi:hypothetical protein
MLGAALQLDASHPPTPCGKRVLRGSFAREKAKARRSRDSVSFAWGLF